MDTNVAIISAIGAALSAVTAIVAVIISVIVYKGQSRLAAQLAKQQAEVSLAIHKSQTLLSQRHLLIPLWDYMSSLNEVDAGRPPYIEPDVLKIVNTLELVALCCEGEMIDKAVIKRTFKDVYIKLYDQVKALPTLPGLKRSGTELLNQNPAAKKFYKELEDDHMSAGQLTADHLRH